MAESLSDREKQLLKDLIDRGDPLPPKYKLSLFADAPTTELVWPGKTVEVESIVLPFQSIEQIDEPRDAAVGSVSLFEAGPSGRQTGGWTNKLIWGDNRLALAALGNGPLRGAVEEAGGLKLVYIDPPFDVGADFEFNVEVGGAELTKVPSVIEALAYRDTWGRGRDSYATMMYERLVLIHRLLAGNGTLVLHSGIQVNHLLRMLVEEVFGAENIIDEVIWAYGSASGGRAAGNKVIKVHEYLLVVSKDRSNFTYNKQYTPYSDSYISDWFKFVDEDGRRYRRRQRGRDDQGQAEWVRQYLDESPGVPLTSVWTDIQQVYADPRAYVQGAVSELTGYPTQKPLRLLERIILSFSNAGDLVGDFFCGSGTTMVAAEMLGRPWIGADLSRFAVHTSRKRLIGVQRALKAGDQPYRSFEILNLGKYERQYFVGVNLNLPEEGRVAESAFRESAYLDLVCRAYSAQRLDQTPPFHAKKGHALVLIGPVDSPVTRLLVESAVEAAVAAEATQVDVLGFEFEMGLSPAVKDEAETRGVQLALRYIPNDVFDKRAIAKGDVRFYDVAYIEVQVKVVKRTVRVTLADFGVFYRQEDLSEATASLRKSQSRVIVDKGMIVKITNQGTAKAKTELLTKQWSDWIDYWAIDFDFQSHREVTRVNEAEGETSVWTGRYVFENEWQSFRTRSDRSLELTSTPHTYSKPGKYRVAVKVIDIFGNDTTKVVDVEVK